MRARRRAPLIAVVLGACAVSNLEPPQGEQSPAEAWQDSVLVQLADAWRDRDLTRIRSLLAQPRAGANAAQQARFATFERLVVGLDVEQNAFVRRGFVHAHPVGGDEPPDLEMDEVCPVRLVLRPAAGYKLAVKARGPNNAKTTLVVNLAVEDVLEDGSRVSAAVPSRRLLSADVGLTAGKPLEFNVPPPAAMPGPEVKMRTETYSAVLYPAGFESDGVAVLVARILLDPLVLRRFPRGFRAVRAQPLKTLGMALTRPAEHLAHVLVASRFLARDGDAKSKRNATAKLIELLRTGPETAEKTARESLLWLAGKDAPAQRDRDAWLRWWEFRRRGQGSKQR
ncbi:MAG: hypothetical protein CMJ85_03305 [Planctomycetes bacterium]|nr:hypothetical protein [Planctomycetota bacterium]